MLQKAETEMASKVASLLQQRLALSLENNKLKQQAVRLQQEKQIVDGEFVLVSGSFLIVQNNGPSKYSTFFFCHFNGLVLLNS